jgi:hypothetical protein
LPVTVAGSLLLKSAALFLLAVLPVRVSTNAGKVVEGDLEGFTESSLLLNQSGKVVEYPFDDLLLMEPKDAEEKTGRASQVTLVGGSRIAAQDVSLVDSELSIELRRQDPLRVPVKQVKAIRFRSPSVATDPQWLGITDRESRGDTLVIRRPGDRLDPQQGVIESIGEGKVAFDLDGQTVNAPIERLEGLVFGGTLAVTEDADIQVTDIYGSTWSVIGIEPSKRDEPLRMRLPGPLEHKLPLELVDSIRWSGGISLLAGSEAASESFQSYLKTNVDEKLMQAFFGPAPIGDSDLLMSGGSSIEYRIESGYRIFAGTVLRAENVADAGIVTVRIELDGNAVWEQQLRDAEPRGFELPVDKSRRLAIKIDSGEDGDLGDTVRISRPRLLK